MMDRVRWYLLLPFVFLLLCLAWVIWRCTGKDLMDEKGIFDDNWEG